MTWGQKFAKIAAEAREELARAEFSEKVILERAREAAAIGLLRCVITPSKPADLRATQAVRETFAGFAKQRLRFEWTMHRLDIEAEPYAALIVSWEQKS